MEGKHVGVLAREDLVTRARDQAELRIGKSLAVVIRDRGGLLERRIRADHLAGNEIGSDAEVLKRPLGLRAPKTVRRHLHLAKTI